MGCPVEGRAFVSYQLKSVVLVAENIGVIAYPPAARAVEEVKLEPNRAIFFDFHIQKRLI